MKMGKNFVTPNQMKEFWELVEKGKINRENFQKFLSNPEDIIKKNKIVDDIYSVVVDYDMSFADMIKVGKYDWVNDDITAEHFPITGSGKVDISFELVHRNIAANSKEILFYMEKNNLRPATLFELLAFGAKYPGKQREFPIIALGSSWVVSDGDRGVPDLDGNDSKRYLGLDWFDNDWGGGYRFLAVRKAS
jgi:hypothetical protein